MGRKNFLLVFIFILLVGCSTDAHVSSELMQNTLLFLDDGHANRAFYVKEKGTAYESTIWNITRELYEVSPSEGTTVQAISFYTKANKNHLTKLISYQTASDVTDAYKLTFSIDNGNSFYSSSGMETHKSVPGGTLRRYWQSQIIDPIQDKMIVFFLQGLLPKDDPLDGMKHWTLWYGITSNGGISFEVEEPLIQKGDGYSVDHPFDGVYIGRNGMMIGDITCLPIILKNQKPANKGKILVPVQICPLNEDGELYNPGGGYTYHYSVVLIGTWNQENKLEWEISMPIVGNPSKTTRGLFEPTLAEMPDGTILMVMRGSNGGMMDANFTLDSFKWYSYSKDGGYTWSVPKPWMCDDNTLFYSPSSCSQLLEHSNGKYYWIGNVSNKKCSGNLPRWPLVIGEVDPKELTLIKDSVMVIDIKRPEQSSSVMYSNFYAREDRVSKDILVFCTPMFENGNSGLQSDWTADAYMYTVNIK